MEPEIHYTDVAAVFNDEDMVLLKSLYLKGYTAEIDRRIS